MTTSPPKALFDVSEDITIRNDILAFDLFSAQRTVASLTSALKARDQRIAQLEGQLLEMQAVLDQFGLDQEQ